jgi:uncharacterized protein DUF5681
MKFQPGHSGNPAGRPQGSLNKKTLATQALLEDYAEEIVNSIKERAKSGDRTAMRLCMERVAPTGRNRPLAITLPLVETPEDAQAALAVVITEFAAGKLSIGDFAALIAAVDRMVVVAERIWNFGRARRYGAKRDAILLDDEKTSVRARDTAQTGEPKAGQTAEKPAAPLYSPVNSQPDGGAGTGAPSGRQDDRAQPGERHQEPLPRAA